MTRDEAISAILEFHSKIAEKIDMYIERHIYQYILRMTDQFKVLLLTGSRQVGKSTLLREKFLPDYEYVTLDDFAELDIAQTDPSLFFRNHPAPVIVDEVQLAPKLFRQVKLLADMSDARGRFFLAGSQTYRLLTNASDSLAGRVCLVTMSSLSLREKSRTEFFDEFLPTEDYLRSRQPQLRKCPDLWRDIWRGGMPAMADETMEWDSYFRSYQRTYLSRDVAGLVNAKNIVKFNAFMVCLAARTGELLNCDSIARDVGVTVKTIQEWISILEASGIIILLRPYEKSVSNRAIKTPKVYFMDTGLVCYLIGWSNKQVAMNGAMSGSLFETFVVSEILKSYFNAGRGTEHIYFYRDRDQREIDMVIEKDGIIYPIEIKKSAHPTVDMARNFRALENIPGKAVGPGAVICQCDRCLKLSETVTAVPVEYI